MPISAAVCSNATPNVRNMLSYVPRVLQVCSVWCSYNSVHSQCWVTVCKMIAITKPSRYEQLLTRNRCDFIIPCIWVTGGMFVYYGIHLVTELDLRTCMLAMPAVSDVMMLLVLGVIIGFLVPAIAIVYATTKIVCVIVRTHHQMTSQVNSINGSNGNTSSFTLKALRYGKNVFLICLAFLILTLPLGFYLIALILEFQDKLPSSFPFVTNWIFVCNSSVKPLKSCIIVAL